jgi:hypothetical protein
VPSAARVVTTVMPVANWAKARRSSLLAASGLDLACTRAFYGSRAACIGAAAGGVARVPDGAGGTLLR